MEGILDYSKQKILTDVDGVLLDWTSAFEAWLKETQNIHVELTKVNNIYDLSQRYGISRELVNSLIERFNSSAWIGFIKPYKDAVKVLADFKTSNWHFEAITSSHHDHWSSELRRRNLEHWFPSTIRRCRCLPTQSPKDDVLKEYEGTGFWWIEDKPENCEAGLKVGLRPILMSHPFNENYDNPEVVRVQNWQDIFDIVTKV
ncbi:MAG: hypothetical protein CMA31_03340 [Euryarchaeota archaeon]|nr:hypothetical protein [Euryarchaeota archaeon]|tara:strand:+ start:2589 stop:3194 length:606 start_codon:yes stop_codon:yes gene_type:complete